MRVEQLVFLSDPAAAILHMATGWQHCLSRLFQVALYHPGGKFSINGETFVKVSE